MSVFDMCQDCQTEYDNPGDRRFHAQPNACPKCGPQVWLEDAQGVIQHKAYDAIVAVAQQLQAGQIVAIKGIAGIHLAVDAANPEAIIQLRQRKHRPHKPLALMAKDIDQIKHYCIVTEQDIQQLTSAAAPIVILPRKIIQQGCQIAPGQHHLGFMLAYSPLHHLLMQLLDGPIVLTSGNCSNDPQYIDNNHARDGLKNIADSFLLHNRQIDNRLDDSVVRLMGDNYQILRRARGYAPLHLILAKGFEQAPDLLAMGGELKNTFCLLKDQQAILSQHMGDLENFATYQDYQKNLQLYRRLFQHQPRAIVVDKHPEYLSTKLGKQWAEDQGLPLIEVQHHHAHIAACLIENKQAVSVKPVLGIVLDGLGFGDDGQLWGGEFLLADYKQSQRLAALCSIPLIGAYQAMKEPWRNTYAQLHHYQLWEQIEKQFSDTKIVTFLKQQPLLTMDQMINRGVNSPKASSCGRLFDAVAAAVGICMDGITYEGQAAIALEALLNNQSFDSVKPYTFELVDNAGDIRIHASTMWQALFADIANNVSGALISAKFHYGLANIMIQLAQQLITQHSITQVVLSGGVFQNKTLLQAIVNGLQDHVKVLVHQHVPANDGGIALGQAAIAAAQLASSESLCA